LKGVLSQLEGPLVFNGNHSNGNHSNGNHSNGNHSNGNHSNGNHSNGNHSNGITRTLPNLGNQPALQERLQTYTDQREQRISLFLQNLEQQRTEYLQTMCSD